MKETVAYLNSLLNDNDKVVVGLSGGPDSMCLLNILLSINKKIEIICAHINHNIRKESIKEVEFVRDYCQKKNVIFETITFDKKSKDKDYSEQELREKRYEYFEQIIKKYKAKYLFTAHHGDDLIETILMRISRGSNLKGYCGFQVETPKEGYKIIKPLIFASKDDINEYNKDNNIPSVKDYTNDEDNYTRNRYRHNVLPFLKSENKNVHLKYLKFSRELTKYYNYVSKVVENEINKRYNKKVLDITEFTRLDDLIQTKIIEYVLDDNYIDNLYLVSDKHVNFIIEIINNPKPNIELDLPDDLRITKSYNKLRITRNKKNNKDYNIMLNGNKELPNKHCVEFLDNTDQNSNYYLKLNSKEIKLPLYIRNRKNGDKMTIKNMKSPKKIKDIFIDCKLPTEERDSQPLLVDSNGEILWIPGIKKSKFDKANNEMYDIILRYK